MASLVLSRQQQSKAFKMFITSEGNTDDFYYQTGAQTPLMTGLYSIFSKQLKEFQLGLTTFINKAGPRPKHDKRLAKPVLQKNPQGQFDQELVQFALAPSGSGKTTFIFNKLTRHYGYYMVSCTLPQYKDAFTMNTEAALSRNPSQGILDRRSYEQCQGTHASCSRC